MTEYDDPELMEAEVEVAEHEEIGFLDQLKISQSRKKIDLVSQIEERITSIAERAAKKIEQLVQEPTKVAFREMSMFQSIEMIGHGSRDYQLIGVEDDGLPVVVYLAEDRLIRNLLSYALAGSGKHADEERELSPSEKQLALVFIGHIASSVFDSMEVIPLNGTPDAPKYISKQDFEESTFDTDYVTFRLEIKFADFEASLFMVSPLMLFESAEPSKFGAARTVEDEKRLWKQELGQRIDDVSMDVIVELASTEMYLTQISELRVGQTLDLKITPNRLFAFSSQDEHLLTGSLVINNGEMQYQILDGAE